VDHATSPQTRAVPARLDRAQVVITVGLTVSAFALSFEALRSLARAGGVNGLPAVLFPLIIDGTQAPLDTAEIQVPVESQKRAPAKRKGADGFQPPPTQNGHPRASG
jgi:hypothetical protein